MITYKPGSSSMRIFFRLNISCTALSSQSALMSSAQPTTTPVTSAALRTRASAARAFSCASCGRVRNRSRALRHPSRERTANSEGRGRTPPGPGSVDSSTAAAPRRRWRSCCTPRSGARRRRKRRCFSVSGGGDVSKGEVVASASLMRSSRVTIERMRLSWMIARHEERSSSQVSRAYCSWKSVGRGRGMHVR
jgi:hypothetical protein